jgi:NAD(P)-dependent dehydrogenase (short-subunit alcohol dehydrogenase family)
MIEQPQRLALVTGGDAGIGRAVCECLREDGLRVIVNGLAGAEDVARTLGGDCIGYDADIGLSQARHGLLQAIAAIGPVDVLVLNAAVQHRARWRDVRPEDLHRQVDVNFTAMVALTQAFVPGMVERGWGRVVMIGSVQEARPNPELPIYGALKAAQEHFARSLAVEVAAAGVTCNVVSPGVVETERSAPVLKDPEVRARWLARIPMGRFGGTRDCAEAVRYLVSEAGAYVTGQTIRVDGGLSVA